MKGFLIGLAVACVIIAGLAWIILTMLQPRM